MTEQEIKELALANGFKLKQQPDGQMDLNPYVYDFAKALMQAAIPKGYVLVPIEPTEAMIDAFFKDKVMPQALDYYARSKARCIEDYKAMIAAAQEPT